MQRQAAIPTMPFGNHPSMDWLAYFSRDDGVCALLAGYRPLARVAQYVVLQHGPVIARGMP